jgi:hypothetical protein
MNNLLQFQKEFVALWWENLYRPKTYIIKMATCPNLLTYVIGQMKDKQGRVKFMTNFITFCQS